MQNDNHYGDSDASGGCVGDGIAAVAVRAIAVFVDGGILIN